MYSYAYASLCEHLHRPGSLLLRKLIYAYHIVPYQTMSDHIMPPLFSRDTEKRRFTLLDHPQRRRLLAPGLLLLLLGSTRAARLDSISTNAYLVLPPINPLRQQTVLACVFYNKECGGHHSDDQWCSNCTNIQLQLHRARNVSAEEACSDPHALRLLLHSVWRGKRYGAHRLHIDFRVFPQQR